MQKALEKKDAEILNLRFAEVITKIDTTTEALITKIDTTAEALTHKIDTLNTKIDTKIDAIDKQDRQSTRHKDRTSSTSA